MPDFTFQERLCAGLSVEGWKETDRSAKYRVFIRNGTRNKMFVGKNGALRYGVNRSNTRTLGDPNSQGQTYTAILKAGEKALNLEGVIVRDRLAALRAASNLQPTPAEPQPDAVNASFDEVPCDTNIPDEGMRLIEIDAGEVIIDKKVNDNG